MAALKHLIISLSLSTAGVCAMAAPVVVNFDDLAGSGTLANGYGGINWNGEWAYYDAPQAPYNPASGQQRVYNIDQANPSTFGFSTDVVFSGAFFAGFENISTTVNAVLFELYLDGNLVATSGSVLPSATPTFLSSGYGGFVDEVRVLSGSGDFYVMDDVTYNTTAAVPEPASLALASLALAGLAVCRRRRV